MFTNRNESARMVAAAGFILKQENTNAIDRMAVALAARKRWEKAKRSDPSCADITLNPSPGPPGMNMLFQGNSTQATPSAVNPSAATRAAENVIPETHFTSSS